MMRRCFVCGADMLGPTDRRLAYACGRDRGFTIACGSCGLLLMPDADPAACRAHLDTGLGRPIFEPDPDVPYGLDLYTLRSAATRRGLGIRPFTPQDAHALRHPHGQHAARAALLRLDGAATRAISLGVMCRPAERDDVLAALAKPGAWTDDIVILLDAQETPAVAVEGWGFPPGVVRVAARPLDGDFAAQRNTLQDLAAHDWMVQLDADEVLAPEAARLLPALAALAEASDVVSIGLPRRNRVDGILSDVYPDVQYRLNRTCVRYAGRVHERPHLEGGWPRSLIALHGAIEHRLSRAHVLARSRRYEGLDPGRGRPEEEAELLRPYRE